jgi:hypothetical protein
MRRDDVRFAAAARDDGLRKISKYTWRAGAAGVVCSALIALAFGHHTAAQASTGGSQRSTSGSSQSTSGGSQSTSGSGQSTSGSGQSTSGGSQSTSGSGGGIVVPAQPPAPAQGGGQVTSGAT